MCASEIAKSTSASSDDAIRDVSVNTLDALARCVSARMRFKNRKPPSFSCVKLVIVAHNAAGNVARVYGTCENNGRASEKQTSCHMTLSLQFARLRCEKETYVE